MVVSVPAVVPVVAPVVVGPVLVVTVVFVAVPVVEPNTVVLVLPTGVFYGAAKRTRRP